MSKQTFFGFEVDGPLTLAQEGDITRSLEKAFKASLRRLKLASLTGFVVTEGSLKCEVHTEQSELPEQSEHYDTRAADLADRVDDQG